MKYQSNPEIKERCKKRYQENSEIHKINKNIRYHKCQEEKKSCGKVQNFLQQVKQGPYYIYTKYHRNLYQCNARFFKSEKHQILTSDLYHPVKSFDEILYICERNMP